MLSFFIRHAVIVGVLMMASLSLKLNAAQVPVDQFIGTKQCAGCHPEQFKLWQGSHHDLAMQVATPASVLGDFNKIVFEHHGVLSRFYRRDKGFFVETEGINGQLQEFEVLYAFGVTPLQQYLVKFPQGRLQALPIAWDSRLKSAGGQRWYHLQGNEQISAGDLLYWTGPYYNWNSRCAECHSTGFEKNYSLVDNSYNSSWTEIDVACEACHGPGKLHQYWAEHGADSALDQDKGFNFSLKMPGGWEKNAGQATAKIHLKEENNKSRQLDTCAHCHSRRTATTEHYLGTNFNDSHQLQLLDENIYYPDGQIQDEDYVYGSFVQSKMYHQGVVCSNCHEPHSLTLKAPGNAVCTQCHQGSIFNTPKHHQHQSNSAGSECVNCHMPATTYMGVDARRDHSLRIPRPDLTESLGVPNACNGCHRRENTRWAIDKLKQWYGDEFVNKPHFGHALASARKGSSVANELLNALANDSQQPAIARASALSLLEAYPTQQTLDTAIRQLKDPDSKVRTAALKIIALLPLEQRVSLAQPLLSDSVKNVRIEAARILADVSWTPQSASLASNLVDATNEYVDSLMVNSDVANSHQSLAILYTQQGRLKDAEQAYQRALYIDNKFVPAMVNLADLYRQTQRDAKGSILLSKAVAVMPDNPLAQFSLGLQQIRQKRLKSALKHLAKAAQLAPRQSYYSYVYAIALDNNQQTQKAVEVLTAAVQLHAEDPQLLSALVDMHRKLDEFQKAQHYLSKLQRRSPAKYY